MILVTVGTQKPFDRLVKEVDRWAAARGADVFAQIGRTDWEPSYISAVPFMEPSELLEKIRTASAIVSHAGMGTIITALGQRKPILIMPRLATLKEHDSDHQLSTVRRFQDKPGVLVAMSEKEIFTRLDELDAAPSPEGISQYASNELVNTLRDFINN